MNILLTLRRPVTGAIFGLAIVALLASVKAQCQPQWLPGPGLPGFSDGIQTCLNWDPDGAGPAPARLVVAGSFRFGGNHSALERAAQWTGSQWAPIGAGLPGTLGYVSALAQLPNGDLIAGGYLPAHGHLVRFDGSSWSPLGGGMNGDVLKLLVMPNGNLVARGYFTIAGTVPASGLASWDGTSWAAIPPPSWNAINALVALPNGNLVVGTRHSCEQWDGTSWSHVGNSSWWTDSIDALTVMPNGDLIAGGQFNVAGNVLATRLARFDGTTWQSFYGGGASASSGTASVNQLMALPNGELIAAGNFSYMQPGQALANRIARFDGTIWHAMGAGFAYAPLGLTVVANGDLIAVGNLLPSLGTPISVMRWDGAAWSEVVAANPGVNNIIRAIAQLPNGDLVVGGEFTRAGGAPADYLARFDGTSWQAFPGGGVTGTVYALAVRPNGELFVGGEFTEGLRRWDGTSWHGFNLNTSVRCLTVMPNGDVIAGGSFTTGGNRVLRWDGNVIAPLGSGCDSDVYALHVMPNGDLIAGGIFQNAGGVPAQRVARWDGTAWSAVGTTGLSSGDYVLSLQGMPNGDLVAAGGFSTGTLGSRHVQRFDGTNWFGMGSGMNTSGGIAALGLAANGDLIAGGEFTNAGGQLAWYIAKWNGTAWSPVGAGANYHVYALFQKANGDLVAGGRFTRMDNRVSAYMATLGCPTVPYGYNVFGTGCPGTLGVPGNVVTAPPRIGLPMSVNFTNLPQHNAFFVFGWNNTTSTAGPLPIDLGTYGAPGCMWRVRDHAIVFLAGSNNVATYNLTIPPHSSFLGAPFYTQSLVLDPTANGLGATMSDAAAAVIGQ